MSILNFSQVIFYIQKINLYGLANVFVPNISSASCELTSLFPVPQTPTHFSLPQELFNNHGI